MAMDESAAVQYRRFAANCLKKAKGSGNSAEWRRMAGVWETLAQVHDGLSMVARPIKPEMTTSRALKKGAPTFLGGGPSPAPAVSFGTSRPIGLGWDENRLRGDDPRESASR
jgi:hypothetical protein